MSKSIAGIGVMEREDEPPPDKRGPRVYRDWAAMAQQMAAEPGQWFLLRAFPSGTVRNIRRGRYAEINPDEHEIITRDNRYHGGRLICDLHIRRKEQ